MGNCPVCEYPSNVKTWDYSERFIVDCPRCGAFCFTRTAKSKLKSLEAIENDWRWKLSYWLRKGYKEEERLEVNYNVLMEIIDDIRLPKPKEQSNNLMQWLSQNLNRPENTITIDPLNNTVGLNSTFSVDVTGTSKGKGFAGAVKRHNFHMQDATHGNSLAHRAPGSIGQNQSPGRVFKGKKMSGHMGNVRRTAQNLEVVRVDSERNLLLIKGAVPGHKGSKVVVQPAVKSKNGAAS